MEIEFDVSNTTKEKGLQVYRFNGGVNKPDNFVWLFLAILFRKIISFKIEHGSCVPHSG